MSFGCERSCSSPRRVSNFKRKVPRVGIYPHIKFERDRLNISRVRVLMSSGSTGGRRGGGDAETITSPNTSFGDIINNGLYIQGGKNSYLWLFEGRLNKQTWAHHAMPLSSHTHQSTCQKKKQYHTYPVSPAYYVDTGRPHYRRW